MPRITARGWGWRHHGRRAWALRGVDLDVEDGERVLLLGPSGAGKSTLLAGVAGLLDGSEDGTGEEEGTLTLDGVPAREARQRAVTAARGHAVTGLLLQDPQAQTVLSRCGDDVAFGLENHAVPPERIWPRVRAALDDVGLPVALDRGTGRLSGGQRQRLALAGVLALAPSVLLLDEPTAMLDPAGARRLREVVAARLAASTVTCLVVEHRVEAWLDLVDRVVILEPGGGVVADGPARRVLTEHRAALAERGVWVPGAAAAAEPRAHRSVGDPPGSAGRLLTASGVAVGRRGLPEPVLTGVDAAVDAGTATVLVGPNGSGKSTLALALAGLARPVDGVLEASPALAAGAGPTPARWRPRELVARVGSVFQDPRHQFVAATVADELAVGPRRLGLAETDVRGRTAALLERLHLAHLARANPFTLSGGEQRRLSVGTALATSPRLLVLDEPTFGQDARTWRELVDLLAGLVGEGSALVAATHDEAFAAALADRTWLAGEGTLRVSVPEPAPARDPAP